MKTTLISLALTLGAGSAMAHDHSLTGTVPREDVIAVSPALDAYATEAAVEGLWARPGLSARDRSIVTVAAVIARGETVLLAEQLDLALDDGVTPAEISEIITHLAFYAGWGKAMAATAITAEVFEARGIAADQLPAADAELLPLDEAAEATRAARVEESTGPASPGLVQDTTAVLFTDLWLRPDLAPRDRSLVTVTSLIANGQVAQVPVHLNRAMDNGLTREEAQEMVSHLAYYAGWPNAFSAAPVVRSVFEDRAN